MVRDDKGRVRAVHPAAQKVIKPKSLNGKTPSTPAEAARSHANQLANMFGVRDATKELGVSGETQLSDAKVVHFAQTINGVPVIGGEINVLVDGAGNLRSMNGETSKAALSGKANVTARDAADTAIKATAKATRMPERALKASNPVLSGYDPELIGGPGSAATVWKVEVTAGKGKGVRQFVLVNAEDGRVVLSFSQVAHADRRTCDFTTFPTRTTAARAVPPSPGRKGRNRPETRRSTRPMSSPARTTRCWRRWAATVSTTTAWRWCPQWTSARRRPAPTRTPSGTACRRPTARVS